jgi:hypothetical protein
MLVLLAGCGPDAGPAPSATSQGVPGEATRDIGSLIVVLPPADGLAEAERARIRLLADRAIEAVFTSGERPVVLEPTTSDALVAAVEAAVRRVGASATVCFIGAGAPDVLGPVLDLYPATRGCALLVPSEPAGSAAGPPSELAALVSVPPARRPLHLTEDVDLERLGRDLGAAARAAAGDTTVLVLDGGDVMLDPRWRRGVVLGAPGALHVFTRATDVLALLDDQEALLAAGVTPGGRSRDGRGGPLLADDDLLAPEEPSLARALPPVGVVVLDASREAAVLVDAILDRGLLVVAPRSLVSGRTDTAGDAAGVVVRWRVRWDAPLATLLRRAVDGGGAGPVSRGSGAPDVTTIVLEPGPAFVAH